MEVSSLGWRTEIALLRYSGSDIEGRGDHLVVRSPYNPQFWWGNCVLVDHVPGAAECARWVKVFAEAFPEAEHVAIGFDATRGERADLAWFADNGLETQADAVLRANALPPPRPVAQDAEVRKLESDDDWARCASLRMMINDRPGDPSYSLFTQRRVDAYRRMADDGRGAFFGAFVDGELAAQLGLYEIERGLARYQAVETHPSHRRKGLAGALIHHAATWGRTQLGTGELVMVADPAYFAIDLYRKVGFAVAETQLRAQRQPVVPTTL